MSCVLPADNHSTLWFDGASLAMSIHHQIWGMAPAQPCSIPTTQLSLVNKVVGMAVQATNTQRRLLTCNGKASYMWPNSKIHILSDSGSTKRDIITTKGNIA